MTHPRRSKTRSQNQNRRRRSQRSMIVESLETRRLLASDVGLGQNVHNAYDVNQDGHAEPLDAVVLINHLNADVSAGKQYYYDVNGDGTTNPLDMLNLANYLNSEDVNRDGEIVGYTVSVTDLDNNSIDSIQVGGLFKVRTEVQDLRSFPVTPTGVFAAYVDVALSNPGLQEVYYGETQQIEIAGQITGLGTFTLSYDGQTTDPITLSSADPGPIQVALEGLSNIENGDVIVKSVARPEATDPFRWDVLFTNNLAEQNVNEMTIDASGVPGTAIVGSVSELFPADPADAGTFLSSFRFFGDYVNGNSAVDEGTDFSEVGGFAGLTEKDGTSFLVWEVTLRALGEGTIEFTPNVPELSSSATLVFGSNIQVIPDLIDFGLSDSITIVNFGPVADTATVTEDSSSNSITVSANDVFPGTGAITDVTDPANGTATISGDNILYTPDANFFGTDTFNYTASDGTFSGTATVTVTVNGTQDAPVAVNDPNGSAVEDSANTTIDVLSNDSDLDGDMLTVLSVNGGTNGTPAVAADMLSVEYTPDANFFGTDTFTYTITDGNSGTDTATVTVTVSNTNDDPVANNDTATVTEDSTGNTISVRANDNDGVDAGETLTVTAATDPANGTTSVVGGATVSYTPDANFFGTDTFTYTITDGNGGSATAMVTVTVTGTPDAPVAVNDNLEVDELSEDNILAVKANDSDVDGDSLTVTFVGTASNGTASLVNGNVEYTPNVDFTGTDTFSYTISDGTGLTDSASITVDVVVAQRPRARADSFTVDEDSASNRLTVSDRDLLNTGASFVLVSNTDASNGTLVVSGNDLLYTPTANFNGTDTFTYTMNDDSGLGVDSSATVTITVTADNDAPVNTVPGSQSVDEDNSLSITGVSVSDVDGNVNVEVDLSVDNGTVTAGGQTGASVTLSGTVSAVNADLAALTYDPTADYFGSDTLTITTDDLGNTGGGSLTDTDTISISITPVDDSAVVTLPDGQSTRQDTDLVLSAANGNPITISDVDTDFLSITLDPQNGTLNGSSVPITFQDTADGINAALDGLTFSPTPGFEGDVAIVVTSSDFNSTTQVTLAIIVSGINDPPVITAPGTDNVDEDQTLTITSVSISDPDAGSFDVTVDLASTNGVLTLATTAGLTSNSGDGSAAVSLTGSVAEVNAAISGLQYTPTANYNGSATISVDVDDLGNTGDGGAKQDSATIAITVNSVNDDPTASDDSYRVITEQGTTILDVLANDVISPDTGETLIVLSTSGSNATIAINGDGTLGYDHAIGFEGIDTFTYTISDGNGGTSTATVTVDVLDFVPSSISGTLFIDADGSGDLSAGERGFAGVVVNLTGTDFRGEPVMESTTTDADGNYTFGDLTPGSYEVSSVQPAGTVDGDLDPTNDSFTVDIPDEGGVDLATGNFGELGLTSPFLSLNGLLASRVGSDSLNSTGMVVSADMSGNLMWYTMGDGWDGYTVESLTIASGMATLRVLDAGGDLYTMTFVQDSVLFRSRMSGSQIVARIYGTVADHMLTQAGSSEAIDQVMAEL
ncbi:MAG: hypothetical protein ACI9HK_003110 [Pirellulaceae bacterium]|jgi:hypothetical protein